MTSEDFVEIMDELGRRIEGPAQDVFNLAMRQVYVELITSLLWFGVSLFFALKLGKLALKKRDEWAQKEQEAKNKGGSLYVYSFDYSFFENEMPLAIAAGAAVGSTLFATINLLYNIQGALNPGWKALTLILERIT